MAAQQGEFLYRVFHRWSWLLYVSQN
jgi:hypothetical protein